MDGGDYLMMMMMHTSGDRPTDQQSDQLLELLEWLFATKNHIPVTSLSATGLSQVHGTQLYQIEL